MDQRYYHRPSKQSCGFRCCCRYSQATIKQPIAPKEAQVVMIIIVRPAYDPVTKAMFRWAQKFIDLSTVEDDLKHDLTGSSATEKGLRDSLRQHQGAHLIAFYGHGKPDSLIVHDRDGAEFPIVHVKKPGVVPSELKGHKVYAVACHSASVLGPALAGAGCLIVGYEEELTLVPEFAQEFGDVVNASLLEWVTKSKTSAEIGEHLRKDWLNLSDDLRAGPPRGRSWWVSILGAFWNGYRVSAFY